MNIWCQETISNQHAQKWHVETRHRQSNIALTSTPNGRTAGKIKYPEQYKNTTGKRLLSGKDNEVSLGDKNIWKTLSTMSSWQDQHLIVPNDFK